jgi:hypothetical protein
MNNREPKIQFSKLLTIGSLLLFIWTLLKGLYIDYTSVYDTTVYVTAITISGGIFGVCLKAYMSKSKAENIYKVQKTMYEDIMDIKLKYNQQMMKLIHEYQISQDEIDMFFLYCLENEWCGLYFSNETINIPVELNIRITPPKNGQKTGIRFAETYSFDKQIELLKTLN